MSPAASIDRRDAGRAAAAWTLPPAPPAARTARTAISNSTAVATATVAKAAAIWPERVIAHRPLPSFTYVVPFRHAAHMPISTAKGSKSDRLLLSPQEALVAGGPAEELERRIQEVFKVGYEHVVIDLRGVPSADSAGIRALVRGHTTAQRLNRRFTLVSPNPNVTELLELSLLTNVLEVVDTLVEAKTKIHSVGSRVVRRRRRAGRRRARRRRRHMAGPWAAGEPAAEFDCPASPMRSSTGWSCRIRSSSSPS